jgi:glycosyltransferase involved in cell wall biosynthesis
MRIAMIGQRGVPATFGGVEKAVEEIGSRLAALGHEVVVYCRSGYGDNEPASFRGMTLRYRWAPHSKHLEALLHSGVSAVESTWGGFDIVHFHALGPGIFSPLPRYFSGAKVVQTIHGRDNKRQKWSPAAQRVLDFGEHLSARVPDATIVVSEELRAYYQDRWARPTEYIPNGVTRPFVVEDGAFLDRLRLDRRRYFLFVGRIVPEKDVLGLLQAFARMTTDHRLVIVGGSSHSDSYVAAVEDMAQQDPRVELAGFVYGDDLLALYSGAGAFVLPSDLEGLPLALLEAASHGIPIVASDIAPHREILGPERSGVRLFERSEGDPGSAVPRLAAAMGRCLAGDDERAGAAALREDVLVRYDWDRVTQETEGLYRSLVDA